jgi:uncharacterized protein (DUF2344 family)
MINEKSKNSTYPRSKIPMELKEKFDLISENFNYNDEFWKPDKQSGKKNQLNTSQKRLQTSFIRGTNTGMGKINKEPIDPR